MKQYELLEAQAKIMRMAEKYGIGDWRTLVKVRDNENQEWIILFDSVWQNSRWEYYKFALGVVEGKPVFEGDELYDIDGRFTVDNSVNENWKHWQYCSWNPPKPKTVMVELLIEDVEFWTSYNTFKLPDTSRYNNASNNFYDACRMALETTKNERRKISR